MPLTMSMNWFLLMATALANLSMGAYVFSRAPRASLNRAFGLLSLATSLWACALAVGYHVDPLDSSSGETTFVIRVAFAAGSLFAIAFLIFIEQFSLTPPKTSLLVRYCLVPVGVVFLIVSFSPWVVVSARSELSSLQIVYGPLHPFFAVYALAGLGATIYLLAGKYRRSDGLEGLQARYVILAFLLSGILITTTNIVVPVVFK